MKNIAVLGSTGSIGRATLDLVRSFPGRFRVVGLTAWENVSLLKEQVDEFNPSLVAIAGREDPAFSGAVACEVLYGIGGIQEVAAHPDVDFVLSAISGAAGLLPTMAAIYEGKTIGLANKETLVMAGNVVNREVLRCGARILPVDSEHSAIFQCLQGQRRSDVKRIILTASGGPFHDMGVDELRDVTPEEALKHPTWKMGKKITIDSATLMNKGLEVIEAHFLFGLDPGRIEVVIHPQSVIHSIVEFRDGSMIAQLSLPDMKGPIAYALSYPDRLDNVVRNCSLHEVGTLTFGKPDTERFPCLGLAYDSLTMGGTAPTVLNASNEVAVGAFIRGIIPFAGIPVIIKKVLGVHDAVAAEDIDTVLWADDWARKKTEELLKI